MPSTVGAGEVLAGVVVFVDEDEPEPQAASAVDRRRAEARTIAVRFMRATLVAAPNRPR
jgi:hypothetical protein